jgi:TetR/AcrR family transcriptional regulator, transcriptional repressor for nem operon
MNKDTKTTILDIAEELLLSRGYNGFSYNDIAEKVGIRKASIHYHFPSKADLGSAVIRRYNEEFKAWCNSKINLSSSDKLKEFFALYKYLSDNGKKICPVGMLTAEYPTLPDVIKKDIQLLLNEEKSWLSHILKEGKKNKEIKSTINPEIITEIILSTLTNSLNRIRIYKNIDLLDKLYKEIKKMI